MSNRKSHDSSILINELLFHFLKLRSNTGIQTEVVDVEDKTTFNGGIHFSLQLHAGMQQGGSTVMDALPHFLADGNGCYQLSYTDMLVFPLQIQKTQADVLEKVFPPVLQHQGHETRKLTARRSIPHSSGTDKC